MVYFLENIILGLKSIYKGEYVRMGYFLENIILGLEKYLKGWIYIRMVYFLENIFPKEHSRAKIIKRKRGAKCFN